MGKVGSIDRASRKGGEIRDCGWRMLIGTAEVGEMMLMGTWEGRGGRWFGQGTPGDRQLTALVTRNRRMYWR